MNKYKRHLPSVAFALIIAYVGYQALTGEKSIQNWLSYREEAVQLQARYDALKSQRITLQSRIAMLDSDSLDLDYLQEQVQNELLLADARDVMIILESPPKQN